MRPTWAADSPHFSFLRRGIKARRCHNVTNTTKHTRPYTVITFVILVHRWKLCEKDIPQRQEEKRQNRQKKKEGGFWEPQCKQAPNKRTISLGEVGDRYHKEWEDALAHRLDHISCISHPGHREEIEIKNSLHWNSLLENSSRGRTSLSSSFDRL